MPIFAPAYRPTKHQQTFLARQQKLESRKRNRGDDSSDDEQALTHVSPEPDPTPVPAATSFHPVNKTDPYHIARHPREEPPPFSPFPHAAVKESGTAKLPIDQELAELNPPLYVPPSTPEDKSTSLRRRHLDNLTTILHRCMLKGDWQRASRTWALLIRTEIAGRGIDVRRNGRWGIGAEMLMRRGAQRNQDDNFGSPENEDCGEAANVEQPQFSDEGYKLAREYYERLILQYPHAPYSQRSLDAATIYPALFNIWIYEVQDRSKRARWMLDSSVSTSDDFGGNSPSGNAFIAEQNSRLERIRSKELEQALPIAQRMDELLISPPYDTSPVLLQLRGMVAVWISDLHNELAELIPDRLEPSDVPKQNAVGEYEARREVERHHVNADDGRQKARLLFAKLEGSGVGLPPEASRFVSEAG